MRQYPLDPAQPLQAPAEPGVGQEGLRRQIARYHGPLLRFFRRHATADAEDLAQEVFARVAQHPSAFERAHFEAYLFQTASNLLRDRARWRQAHHCVDHVSLHESGYEGEVPSEEIVYQGREALQTFMHALMELSETRRLVFLLHRYDGLSYAAIASRVGISVSAVEKHMMKALLHFSSRLGDV